MWFRVVSGGLGLFRMVCGARGMHMVSGACIWCQGHAYGAGGMHMMPGHAHGRRIMYMMPGTWIWCYDREYDAL